MLLAFHVSFISIGIILLFLLFFAIGFKVGFLTKFINLANSLCGFVFSLLFCKQFSNAVIYRIWGDDMAASYTEKFRTKNPTITNTKEFLDALGLPSFITSNIDVDLGIDQVYVKLGNVCASIVCAFIAFCVLFFGITIICFILKLVVAGCRQSKLIRVIDGILGSIFYVLLTYIGICILLFILTFIMQSQGLEGFRNWVINDMCLDSDKFTISKFLYNNNIIGNFFKIFF